jgi:hypothetical protein
VALVSLQSLLLANNSISAVDPAIWQPMLTNGFNLLDMSGNPSQCFTGLDNSDSLAPTVVCECGTGLVGKAAAHGQLASGCVVRSQAIAQPPAVAVVGSTYVFALPNASALIQSLCPTTNSSSCCSASLVSNTSVALQVLTTTTACPLLDNWWYIDGVSANSVFLSSVAAAQEAADGFALTGLPHLRRILLIHRRLSTSSTRILDFCRQA